MNNNAQNTTTSTTTTTAAVIENGFRAMQNRHTRIGACMPRRQEGSRIIAQDVEVSNDTWVTGLNNNDLVIGPTGAGKTRYYLKPNLMQLNGSFVVTDPKGQLVKEVGPLLHANGYRVLNIDFTNLGNSFGYNPFDFVRIDERTGKVNEQDIMQIANTLCPIENFHDAFWDFATRNYLGILCGFVLEQLRPEERNLKSVATLLSHSKARESRRESKGATDQALDSWYEEHPDSYSGRKWAAFRTTCAANRMYASILGIAAEKLDPLVFDTLMDVYQAEERIDFKVLGQQKTALFLTVSDTDRSIDRLVALFYTQALQELCRFADNECPGGALDVPVRLYLDDFATNCKIEDFDKTISVIRSRNISVSVVLQSITQLETLYGHASSLTIVNGCDHWLYLGGQDIETMEIVSRKANKAFESIVNMNIGEAWMFERGAQARKVKRYDLKSHPLYHQLPEAQEAQDEKDTLVEANDLYVL